MNRWLSLALFGLLCFAPSAFPAYLEGATPEQLVGGAENLRLITNSTSMKVFRIVDLEKLPKRTKTVRVDGYKCLASPVMVSTPEVGQVITAVQEIYNFGPGLMCIFEPGIIIRFEGGTRTLDMAVCFSCHEVLLYTNGKVLKRTDPKFVLPKNTFHGGAREAFVAVAKRAFPEDKTIQKLNP